MKTAFKYRRHKWIVYTAVVLYESALILISLAGIVAIVYSLANFAGVRF